MESEIFNINVEKGKGLCYNEISDNRAPRIAEREDEKCYHRYIVREFSELTDI